MADHAAVSQTFSYDEAFSRNIGWVTAWEQQVLRGKTVAIAGMGGVGGVHLLTLARLGIGRFHIADLDHFEVANFNRQVGANMKTVGRPKVEVLAEMARDINPEIEIVAFDAGVTEDNADAFLDGVDLFVDGFDFFVLDMRAKIFALCHDRGIPAITAAPIGLGVAYLVFSPTGMSFEDYFRLQGHPDEEQYVNFLMGLVPKALHRTYLMDPTRMDLSGKRGPSSGTACQLCSGVAGIEAVKLLLGRGKVRAAPYYHQFDAYRGKWVCRKLRGGNRNPLQRLKLKIGYRAFSALSRQSSAAPARTTGPELAQILDLARWAPSGDNAQPWRFTILSGDKVRIRIADHSADDVYEYNDAQPTLLSAGFLLETMRIAASAHGRMLWWHYVGREAGDYVVEAELPKAPGVRTDPLHPFVPVRSVDRRAYKTRYLTPNERQALTAALGDELTITWHETRKARWRMAGLAGLATDIRLRIPEAFEVHQRILDWENKRSPDGVPAAAIGLDPLTRKIMRGAMRGGWAKMDRMNRMPGGTVVARLQMDYLPGHGCAAHFAVARKAPPGADDAEASLIRAGQALQRFWLTATELGLSLQPALAPLCFGFYGRHGIDFTADPHIRAKAATLAERLTAVSPAAPDDVLFLGRLGQPRSRGVGPRSVRRSLEELMDQPLGAEGAGDAPAAAETAGEGDVPVMPMLVDGDATDPSAGDKKDKYDALFEARYRHRRVRLASGVANDGD